MYNHLSIVVLKINRVLLQQMKKGKTVRDTTLGGCPSNNVMQDKTRRTAVHHNPKDSTSRVKRHHLHLLQAHYSEYREVDNISIVDS